MKLPQPNPPRQPEAADPGAPASTPGQFRVILADESPIFRYGLRHLLTEDGRFDILAETDQGEFALKLVAELKPDAAVIDATLPGINGLEVAALLKAKESRTNLVIIALQKDEDLFNQAISLDIRGYVLKRDPANEVMDCIAAVASGEAYVSPLLTDFLLRRRGRADSLGKRKPGLGHLTNAERRILKRIAQGKTSREIAAECGISPRTVDSHRSHICEKLGLKGSNRLLQFALEHRDALSHLAD
jgi:DNA-binding NarL/FixJ family response regulator